jgi:hypothetical protein
MRPAFRLFNTARGCTVRSVLVAVAIAALTLGTIAPAAPQPFSDVPGPHWAAEAIAQLAAKGLVEGYPDGTFGGDRAMTRYEMAEVVARMLARVEVLVNAPRPVGAAPEVTPDDLALLQRLVDELRDELADKRVRIPPLEEEVHALRSRISNVKITGLFRVRYDETRSATGAPIAGNGNPTTGTTGAGSSPLLSLPGLWLKLEFDAFVANNIHMILALDTGGINGGYNIFNSAAYGNPAGTAMPQGQFANIDNMFLDWKNAWGTPLEIWLGRFGGNTGAPGGAASSATLGAAFGTHPIQFGPFGLLMNTTGDTWADSTANSGFNIVDGLAVFGEWPDFADLKIQGVITRVVGNTGAKTYFSGEDAFGLDANVLVIPGLRAGAYTVANNIVNPAGIGAAAAPAPNGPLWHLYGPGGGSMNPATANCPVVAGSGIQCPAAGSGLGGYLQWDVVRSVHVDAEVARWNDTVNGSGDAGYQLNVTLDAGALTKAGHNWQLQIGYLNFGQNFYPPYGGAEADISMADVLYPGNVQGVLVTTTFNPVKDNDAWTLYATFFGGNHVSNGQGVSEYEAGVEYTFAPQAQVVFLVRNLTISGVNQIQLVRTDVNYTF